MELRARQEVTVGLLVMVAVALFVGGMMWLSGVPFFGGRQITLQVLFADVQGLAVGDPVTVSGMQIGRVAEVQLEDVGRVHVFLQLTDDEWRPRIDATAEVKSLDFLGAKYIDYRPGRSDQLLREGQLITGMSASDPLSAASGLTDQAASVLTGVQSFVEPAVKDQFMRTMSAAEQALSAVARVGTADLTREATQALHTLNSSMGRIDSLLGNSAIEESVNQMDEITESIREMAEGLAGVTVAMRGIMEAIEQGQGSVGLMLSDSTMYRNSNDVLVSLRRLLDDMRQRPGRYFRLEVF